MNLINWIASDRCGKHHYGDAEFTGKIKIEKDRAYKQVKEKCQHAGCGEQRTYWKIMTYTHHREYSPEKDKVLNVLNSHFHEKLNEEIEADMR